MNSLYFLARAKIENKEEPITNLYYNDSMFHRVLEALRFLGDDDSTAMLQILIDLCCANREYRRKLIEIYDMHFDHKIEKDILCLVQE